MFRIECKYNFLLLKVLYCLRLLVLIVMPLSSAYAGEDSGMLSKYNEIEDEFRALQRQAAVTGNDSVTNTLRSARGSAEVRLGGELFLDYIGSIYEGDGVSGTGYEGNWALHNSNLRFDFIVNSDLRTSIKLDLSDSPYRGQSQVMEEALVIWDAVCGGPIGLFFGVGEVPYGQDRTLGIIQSYNHTEGNGSSEGPTILSSPYLSEHNRDNVVYHPGEIDRVIMAGLSYTWEDAIRVEFAFFQPGEFGDTFGIYDRVADTQDWGVGNFATRIWWNTPVAGLVAEVSGVRKYESQRGDKRLFGSDAVKDEYAVSLGIDWNVNSRLELFAEYEHGFNWGFTRNRHTDTLSVGMLYSLTERLTVGGMLEWLHISRHSEITDLNKLVLHTQYKFANGVYLIAEYGAELYNWNGALTNVFAVRSGISF